MAYCSSCGEVIDGDDCQSDELCDSCFGMMQYREDVPFDENDDEIIDQEDN